LREVHSEAPDVLPDSRRRQTNDVLLGDSLRQTRGPGLTNLLNARSVGEAVGPSQPLAVLPAPLNGERPLMIRLNLSQTLLLSTMLVGGIGFAQAESDLENATTKNLEASEARSKAAQAGAEHDKKKMKEMEEKAEQLEAEAKKMQEEGK
jgi:hypothetical protein